MIDETTDINNREQVTIVIRRIDENLEVCEEFIGLYTVDTINASTLFSVIKDTFIRLNLPMTKLRGQCYDGCSTMSGCKTGVAKRVRDEEPRAVFTHCYSHSLNLAANDYVKKSPLMKASLETTHEITKLVKLSPRRDAIFRQLKAESDSLSDKKSLSIRLLCPTRWTVRADSLLSIIDNYSVLLSTWDEAYEAVKDTESKARIQGVHSQMESFNFLFGTVLGEILLRHTDNLSKSLQHKTRCAAEGQGIGDMVVRTLQSLRSDECYDLFWLKVTKMAESFDIEPQLPRRRKVHRKYDHGSAEGEFHDTPKAYFKQHYFEAIDLAVNCIQDRFKQPGYEVYQHLELLLLKASENKDYETEFDFVTTFYGEDLQPANLHAQLVTFGMDFQGSCDLGERKPDIFDIKKYFCSLTSAQRDLLSQVCIVLKLVLIMPATNSTSERSFSALRRLKTYLRNTISQERLNNLIVLHVHKDITDTLNLKSICNEFIGDSEHGHRLFGTY
ncbi:hypothetical protein SPONN_1502 [uncultured Candidatus Thioglobus sp.]|nr:hypothetical protein SPONN_1502 [uncultured Candidatus Thioglobus sp.]